MRALLLDLDDTLFDRRAAIARWAAVRGLDPTIEPAWTPELPHELVAHVEPEPGLREILARVRVPIAVVTNGGGAQRAKLAATGLADLVGRVFVSSELGIDKPDPRIFEAAAAWAGVAPRECTFVGDDPERDLAPARALGMRTAWRARRAGDVDADVVIRATADWERV